MAANMARVFVVNQYSQDEVVAYYAWCMSSVRAPELPDRWRRGVGRYSQPVALLARLGVDLRHERRGIGRRLVQDVIARASALGNEIGCRGLLIHAESTAAQDFYLRLTPKFESSPTDDLHLVLLMKDIHKTLLK